MDRWRNNEVEGASDNGGVQMIANGRCCYEYSLIRSNSPENYYEIAEMCRKTAYPLYATIKNVY